MFTQTMSLAAVAFPCLLAAPTVLGAASETAEPPSTTWNAEISDNQDPSKSYNFLAIGDWGNDDVTQLAAAAGMGVVANEIDAAQVIALGDNFYHTKDSR